MAENHNTRKGRMHVWPFLCSGGLTLVLALSGWLLSSGLPWGVDDGVKRLMARSWADFGGKSVILKSPAPTCLEGRFFPIPPPFAKKSNSGYQGIFPGLFPVLGGIFYMTVGSFGFYLLPALCLTLLLLYFLHSVKVLDPWRKAWALLMLTSALIFYGLTFWEHPLSLLLLGPLFLALQDPSETRWRWLGIGASFGAAVYLRSETILLLPLAGAVMILKRPRRSAAFLRFGCGLILTTGLALICERVWSGRWIAPQSLINLGLAFENVGWGTRIERTLASLFNSPLPWQVYAVICFILAILALTLKKPLLWPLGLAVVSVISLAWGWWRGSAFSLAGQNQGLLLAWPWIPISLLGIKSRKWREEHLLLVGCGFILLIYLLAHNRPSLHWGPRFLFPALLPLALSSLKALDSSSLRIRWLMAITAVAALFNSFCAVTVLAQHGAGGRETLAAIREADPQVLILDQWYRGADLEPLWGRTNLAWAGSRGDLEEILIQLRAAGWDSGLGWLKQESGWVAADLPLVVISQKTLSGRGGWRGELLTLKLGEPEDNRWGTVYWHSGRRRAEAGDLSGALERLRQAGQTLRDNADLHYDLALALGRLDRIQEALEELRTTLSINPQHPQALRLWRQLVR